MSTTTPTPDDPRSDRGPRLKSIGQQDVREFYGRLTGLWSFNGRHGDREDSVLFLLMPSPPKPLVGSEIWRAQVRAGIVKQSEVARGRIPALKERARVKVYEHIFGWLLDDPEDVSRRSEDDVALFL